MKYKNLFTPISIGSLKLKNRFAMAPMGPLGLSDAEAVLINAVSTTIQKGQKAAPA